MALKKHEQAQLDMIQKSLDMLVNIGGMTNDDMLTHLNPMIAGFEAETNMKVVIAPTESGKPVLDVVDLKKDFVRSRWNPSETLQGLRAKSLGVPIEVKVTKADDFTFSNKQIVSALRELANSVETMDVEFHTLGLADLERLPGDILRLKVGDVASDDDEDEEQGSAPSTIQTQHDAPQVSTEQNLQANVASEQSQTPAQTHQEQGVSQQVHHEQQIAAPVDQQLHASQSQPLSQGGDITAPGQ